MAEINESCPPSGIKLACGLISSSGPPPFTCRPQKHATLLMRCCRLREQGAVSFRVESLRAAAWSYFGCWCQEPLLRIRAGRYQQPLARAIGLQSCTAHSHIINFYKSFFSFTFSANQCQEKAYIRQCMTNKSCPLFKWRLAIYKWPKRLDIQYNNSFRSIIRFIFTLTIDKFLILKTLIV